MVKARSLAPSSHFVAAAGWSATVSTGVISNSHPTCVLSVQERYFTLELIPPVVGEGGEDDLKRCLKEHLSLGSLRTGWGGDAGVLGEVSYSERQPPPPQSQR